MASSLAHPIKRGGVWEQAGLRDYEGARMSAEGSDASQTLWGWEDLFVEIERLLRESNERYLTSSPEFAEYVVERMQVAIIALA